MLAVLLVQLLFARQAGAVAAFAEGRRAGIGLVVPLEARRVGWLDVDKSGAEVRAKGEADGVPFALVARKIGGEPEGVVFEAAVAPEGPTIVKPKSGEFAFLSRKGLLTKPRLRTICRSRGLVQPFLFATSPEVGCFLWVSDLSALDRTLRATAAWPRDSLFIGPQGFGLSLNVPGGMVLPAGRWLLSRAALFFLPEPKDKAEEASLFLRAIRRALDVLELPEPQIPNWREVAEREVSLLERDGRAWVEWEGERFLRAYFACRPYAPELITQVDVARGLWRFYRRYGKGRGLLDRLVGAISRFYLPQLRAFHNNISPPRRIDSWYFVGQLANLARLASEGFPVDKGLLWKSLREAIRFGRTVGYRFPVFADPKTFKPLVGAEPDVAGCYVWLMLEAQRLFGDRRFLEEARRAADVVPDFGFSLAYELHMTAASCAGLLRLYKATGSERWAEAALVPLANLVANSWLWESNFGPAALYRTTMALSAMPGCPYAAMKESWEAWDYVREALGLARGVWPRYALDVARLFVAHQPSTMWASVASKTPRFGLWREPRVGGGNPPVPVPVEDLRAGWLPNGLVGEELYGAGGPLAFAAALGEGGMRGRPRAVLFTRQVAAFEGGRYVVSLACSNPAKRRLRLALSAEADGARFVGPKVVEVGPGERRLFPLPFDVSAPAGRVCQASVEVRGGGLAERLRFAFLVLGPERTGGNLALPAEGWRAAPPYPARASEMEGALVVTEANPRGYFGAVQREVVLDLDEAGAIAIEVEGVRGKWAAKLAPSPGGFDVLTLQYDTARTGRVVCPLGPSRLPWRGPVKLWLRLFAVGEGARVAFKSVEVVGG